MSNNIIEISNVSYSYPNSGNQNVNAVEDVSLNIKEGEFLAILGHNGSGKSTLSKMLNGLIIPDSGDIKVLGKSIKDKENILDIRKKVGMVFQNPDNQIVATIVEEDVAFGPENLNYPTNKIKQLVDKSLKMVDMLEYKKHAPHMLSGGQKQRIAIAGILAMEPACIVLDEPTSMLDPNGRKDVIDTIKRLNRENKKTIVLITHYMDEAVEADRVAIMSNGKIVMEGEPVNIFSEIEEVKSYGLDVPQVTELAYELKKEGMEISKNILSIEELLEIL